MTRDWDVVGLGVHALDLIGVIDGYPEPDTKAPLLEFDLQGGGVTATALVTCARLGLRARYVGKVGTDFWARVALRTLRREGVDVRHVLRAPRSPGHVSLVPVDRRSGARALFFRRPAAYALQPEELDRGALTAGGRARPGCASPWTESVSSRASSESGRGWTSWWRTPGSLPA